VFDLRARQQFNRGYSDGMARGMEIVLTPLLLGGVGWLLDGWLGTGKVLAVAFGIFGIVGVSAKLKLGYDKQMAQVEAGKPRTRGLDNVTPAAPEEPGP
jgi:hypothetical protein